MTEQEAEDFVRRFDAAWNDADGPGFPALWREDGVLHAPHFKRPIFGHEQPALRAFWRVHMLNHRWRLIEWTHRADQVAILWESENRVGDQVVAWRGVDWLTVEDGKIVKEVVYYDTAPIRGLRSGQGPPPMIDF